MPKLSVKDATAIAEQLATAAVLFADTSPDLEGREIKGDENVMQGWPPYRDKADPEAAAFGEFEIDGDKFVVVAARVLD